MKAQHTKSIGSGLLTTGNRTYKSDGMVLVSWTQKRCVICGRFLTKFQRMYCSKHKIGTSDNYLYNKKAINGYNATYRKTHHNQELARQHTYRIKKRLSSLQPVLFNEHCA